MSFQSGLQVASFLLTFSLLCLCVTVYGRVLRDPLVDMGKSLIARLILSVCKTSGTRLLCAHAIALLVCMTTTARTSQLSFTMIYIHRRSVYHQRASANIRIDSTRLTRKHNNRQLKTHVVMFADYRRVLSCHL